MMAAVDRIRPKRLQPKARRGEVSDRAVGLLQRVAERRGDARALQSCIEEANVDLQRTRVTRRAADQRSQSSVFLCRQLADADGFDSGVERCTFER
jgi:hypothetical protein